MLAASEDTTLPPGATATVESIWAEVMVEPAELVLLTMAAGARVEVVNVWPWSFVVVTGTATDVGASAARAEDVC